MRTKAIFVAAITFLALQNVQAADFMLTSPQIKDGKRIANEQVFNDFGCKGDNVSPALQWTEAPKDAKSFAITVYDPDAPTGSGWWHWIIFNIPASVNALPKNAGDPQSGLAPAGSIQSMTDYGRPGYGGPCPPVGAKPHRYIFTVYALKIDTLPLDKNASAAMVGYYLNQNMIKKAVLKAFYSR